MSTIHAMTFFNVIIYVNNMFLKPTYGLSEFIIREFFWSCDYWYYCV